MRKRRVIRRKDPLPDLVAAPVERLGFRDAPKRQIERSKVVQRRRQRREELRPTLVECNGAQVTAFGLEKPSQRVVDYAQIVPGHGYPDVRRILAACVLKSGFKLRGRLFIPAVAL